VADDVRVLIADDQAIVRDGLAGLLGLLGGITVVATAVDGAEAIHQALVDRELAQVPSVRTINRILGRRGALDGKQRTRRPPPPTGWYLPDVATGGAELDSIDIVEGLVIKEGPHVEVLNAVSVCPEQVWHRNPSAAGDGHR